ncbi:MAG: FAD-dependent oxidoreductase, partial [Candidatus Binatia bacterium]
MSSEPLDVLVVGGGITGAGVARDAALRGFRVGLVERSDFAAGTSSRSSKLIHGGVRYLQQGDIPLVLEAAEERRILRRIAPHLTQPRPMMFPTYGTGTHTKLNVGLWTYEKLARIPEGERHEMLDRSAALEREPALNPDGLTGAALYPENLTDDARLVISTLRSARRGGALLASYAE